MNKKLINKKLGKTNSLGAYAYSEAAKRCSPHFIICKNCKDTMRSKFNIEHIVNCMKKEPRFYNNISLNTDEEYRYYIQNTDNSKYYTLYEKRNGLCDVCCYRIIDIVKYLERIDSILKKLGQKL